MKETHLIKRIGESPQTVTSRVRGRTLLDKKDTEGIGLRGLKGDWKGQEGLKTTITTTEEKEKDKESQG